MRGYVTEFIGTFGLVFTVGCAVIGKAALAPLAIGAPSRQRSSERNGWSAIYGHHADLAGRCDVNQ
jgi:glycerol uptake facilitator-like aquaporin